MRLGFVTALSATALRFRFAHFAPRIFFAPAARGAVTCPLAPHCFAVSPASLSSPLCTAWEDCGILSDPFQAGLPSSREGAVFNLVSALWRLLPPQAGQYFLIHEPAHPYIHHDAKCQEHE